jgi:tetratricopeptide (TPR) repeat protein
MAVEARRWTDLAQIKSIHADQVLRAGVLRSAGYIALNFNEFHRSKELLSQSLLLYRQNLDEWNAAWSLVYLGGAYQEDPQDVRQGLDLCKQALALFRNQDDKSGLTFTFNILGELARSQKDYKAAQRYYEDSLLLAVETGASQREAIALNNLSFVAYHQQNYRLALELAHRFLTIARELKSDFQQACFIATLAGPSTALGHPYLAARLLGASNARFEASGTKQAVVDQSELDDFETATRNLLGDKAFQEAWQTGYTLTLQEAVSLAITELDLGE